MRISDWSSDVCSSDLEGPAEDRQAAPAQQHPAAGRAGRVAGGVHRPWRLDLLQHQRAQRVRARRPRQAAAGRLREGLRQVSRPAAAAHHRHQRRRGHFSRSAQRRSEEHTSELQSLTRTPYAVFCLKKKKYKLKALSNFYSLLYHVSIMKYKSLHNLQHCYYVYNCYAYNNTKDRDEHHPKTIKI